jgi:hypothetical protein
VDAVAVATRLHQAALPTINELCQTSRMRNLTATICLIIAVLLGSAGESFAFDLLSQDEVVTHYGLNCESIKRETRTYQLKFYNCGTSRKNYRLRINQGKVVPEPEVLIMGVPSVKNCNIYDSDNWICADATWSERPLGAIDGVYISHPWSNGNSFTISTGWFVYSVLWAKELVAGIFGYKIKTNVMQIYLPKQISCKPVPKNLYRTGNYKGDCSEMGLQVKPGESVTSKNDYWRGL